MFLYCKFSSGFALFFTKDVKLPNDSLNLQQFQGKKSSKLWFFLYRNALSALCSETAWFT